MFYKRSIYKEYKIELEVTEWLQENIILGSWGNILRVKGHWSGMIYWLVSAKCMLPCTGSDVPLQKLENFMFLTVKSCNVVNTFRCKLITSSEEQTVLRTKVTQILHFGRIVVRIIENQPLLAFSLLIWSIGLYWCGSGAKTLKLTTYLQGIFFSFK